MTLSLVLRVEEDKGESESVLPSPLLEAVLNGAIQGRWLKIFSMI